MIFIIIIYLSVGCKTEKEKGCGNKNAKTRTKARRKNMMMVIGHRGSGMNLLQSPHNRMKFIKENSILALNTAGNFNLDFIEFDVQVISHFIQSFSLYLHF